MADGRSYGSVLRTVSLPCEMKNDQIKASFKDGVVARRRTVWCASTRTRLSLVVEPDDGSALTLWISWRMACGRPRRRKACDAGDSPSASGRLSLGASRPTSRPSSPCSRFSSPASSRAIRPGRTSPTPSPWRGRPGTGIPSSGSPRRSTTSATARYLPGRLRRRSGLARPAPLGDGRLGAAHPAGRSHPCAQLLSHALPVAAVGLDLRRRFLDRPLGVGPQLYLARPDLDLAAARREAGGGMSEPHLSARAVSAPVRSLGCHVATHRPCGRDRARLTPGATRRNRECSACTRGVVSLQEPQQGPDGVS